MGSRYGGLKQMDPVDDLGNVILHYSLHDAIKAGFKDVVFVIKEENEEDFRRIVSDKVKDRINVHFAFQSLCDIPEGFAIPEDRVKPWGTGHAVRACRHIVKDAPFLVINADDYYGSGAFKALYDFLCGAKQGQYAMAGYRISNTVTENGHVARGVCECDEKGFLTVITERTHIEKRPYGAAFTEDDGKVWTDLPADTLVSMNFWGFTSEFMQEADRRFESFLAGLDENTQLKGEYFLPGIVEQLLDENKCTVQVIPTEDQWYGVTYKEDKPDVVAALAKKRAAGLYPDL